MLTMFNVLDTEGLTMLNKVTIKLASTALLACVWRKMALSKEEPTTFTVCSDVRNAQISDVFVGR